MMALPPTAQDLPTVEELSRLDDYQVFDKDGKAVAFANLYKGENVARRILLLFVRHFFCGNCQEYLRTLSSTITPASLLSLPHPTFIAIIGCGSPALIPTYAAATACPYPIYADPCLGLYAALRLSRTLDAGPRPAYQRRSTLRGVVDSIGQSLRHVRSGAFLKAGDWQQVGGEFLLEPLAWEGRGPALPVGNARRLGPGSGGTVEESVGGDGDGDGEQRSVPHRGGERKCVTWCHRMRNTRDHVEIPELREVLGLDAEEGVVEGEDGAGGAGAKPRSGKRHRRALVERKGTGLGTRREDVRLESGAGEADVVSTTDKTHAHMPVDKDTDQRGKEEMRKDPEAQTRSAATSNEMSMGPPVGNENVKL